MIHVKRNSSNPILIPNTDNSWEAYAVLNGSVVVRDNTYHILYRAISDVQDWHDARMRISSIGHATSIDGYTFSHRKQFIIPEYAWEQFGCEDPRVTFIDGKYYIFYTAISSNPPSPQGIRVGVAVTKDFSVIEEKHLVTPFNAKAMVLFPEKINGKYAALLTVDTDNPPAKIAIVYFDKLSQLWDQPFWEEWYRTISEYTLPLVRGSKDHIEVGLVPVATEKGWLFIFSYIQNYFTQHKLFGIEAALLDKNNPLHVIQKTDGPFMTPQSYPELYGTIPNIIFPSGGLQVEDTLRIYYGASDTSICEAEVSISEMLQDIAGNTPQEPLVSVHSGLHAIRFEGSPILYPMIDHKWEEKAVLNAAVFTYEHTNYILYRAMNKNYVSTIGLATTTDGLHINERLLLPIYTPHEDFELSSTGGSSGCEDPRISLIGDRLVMHYTGYNGNIPRVAHTSIALADFINNAWNWEKAVAISDPNVMDKNSAVFPEKIHGKYAILHRLDTRVWLDFANDFSEFGEGKRWLGGNVLFSTRENMWDSEKVGVGGPPIKTELGWLLIYHGISQADQKYRLGIVVLDINEITNVIYRSDWPILEPKLPFENSGIRPGAVFTCGSGILDDTLYIYYGAADSSLCVARFDYSFLIDQLRENINK